MNAARKPDPLPPAVPAARLRTQKTARGLWVGMGLAVLACTGFAAWHYGRGSDASTELGLLPGTRVDIWLGRASIVIEGDAADPLENCDIQQDGQALPLFRSVFSDDGRYLAVTEGPRPGEDHLGATRTYRVHLLH